MAAKLLGIDPPQELSMEEARTILTPMALSFYAGCVRVKNDKLKTALGVTLRYPTYREGLRALFDEGYEARDPLDYSRVIPASRIICAQASIDSLRNAGASAQRQANTGS